MVALFSINTLMQHLSRNFPHDALWRRCGQTKKNRSSDKIQTTQKMNELWNNALHDAYIPGGNLTVDE